METKTITVRKKLPNDDFCNQDTDGYDEDDCFFYNNTADEPYCCAFEQELEIVDYDEEEDSIYITHCRKCKQCLKLKEGEIVG